MSEPDWARADRTYAGNYPAYIEYTLTWPNYKESNSHKAIKAYKWGLVTSLTEKDNGVPRKWALPLFKLIPYPDANNVNPLSYALPGYYFRCLEDERGVDIYDGFTVMERYLGVHVTGTLGNAVNPRAVAPVSATTQNTYGFTTADSAERSASNPTSAVNRQFMDDLRRRRGTFYSGQQLIDVQSMLKKLGYTDSEIAAYVRAQTDAERRRVDSIARARQGGTTSVGGGGGSSGGGGGGTTANQAANFGPVSTPQLQTQLVVRMPSGFTVPDPSELSKITKPAIHQTFTDPSGKKYSYTYVFDFVPNSIQYSGLGSEWVEIPRAENFAFVDWSRYQLMKVSMSWVVATDRVEKGGAKVRDGLFNSVDSTISTLRRMAQRKYPVTIVNMDDLLSVKLKVDENNSRSVRGMQFVITDLSVTASRRTGDPSTGGSTSPSKIAVAQVNMTLQECPIETVQIISMPTLSIPFTPPRPPGSTGNPLASSGYNLASDAFYVSSTPPPSTP